MSLACQMVSLKNDICSCIHVYKGKFIFFGLTCILFSLDYLLVFKSVLLDLLYFYLLILYSAISLQVW